MFKNKFNKKRVFLGAAGVMVCAFLLIPISAFWMHSRFIQESLAQQGVTDSGCYSISEGFDMIIKGYGIPELMENTTGEKFPGHSIYRYVFPYCPELNTKDRPKLYNFRESGALDVLGGFAIGGEKSFLLSDNDKIGWGRYSEKKLDVFKYLKIFKDSFTIALNRSAIIPDAWHVFDPTFSGFQGPGAYLDSKSSELRLDRKRAVYTNRENRIRKLNFSNEPGIIDYENLGIGDPTDFEYKDGFFYITDQRYNHVIKYNAQTSEIEEKLGDESWNWNPQGIAIDDDDILYITDSAQNRIIKTKMNGEGWRTSFEDDYYDYYSRLFITGEENLEFLPKEGAEGVATRVAFPESGTAGYWVEFKNQKGEFDYRPDTEELEDYELHKDKDTKVFSENSLYFNGESYLEVPRQKGLGFENDNFLIDFWVNFDSTDKDQILISQPDVFLAKYDSGEDNLVFKLALDMPQREIKAKDMEVKGNWNPQPGRWYHVAIERYGPVSPYKEVKLFINGNKVASSGEQHETVFAGRKNIYIGGGNYDPCFQEPCYIETEARDFLEGNIDNLRITKGYGDYKVIVSEFLDFYYFDNPQGIETAGDYLYIADSGNDRIVKLNKDFSYTDWDTFGKAGEETYEFISPQDIEYSDASNDFYISDSGNRRVVRSDLANWSDKLSDQNFAGSSWIETIKVPFETSPLYSENFNGEARSDIFDGKMYFYNRGPHSAALDIVGFQEKQQLGGEEEEDFYLKTDMSQDLNDTRPDDCPNCYDGSGNLKSSCDPDNDGNCNGEVCCTACGLHSADRCCGANENYPVVAFNLTPFLRAQPYSHRDLKINLQAKYSGELEAFLTRNPGASRIENDESRSFNRAQKVFGPTTPKWQNEEITFPLPERVSIDDPRDVYLTFNTCGELSFNFLKVTLNTGEPGLAGLAVHNGEAYVTDKNSGRVIAESGSYGGKNFPQSDEIGKIGFGKIKFAHPREIQFAETGAVDGKDYFYVLDGTSGKDMAVESREKVAQFYGTKQKDDYYTEFSQGGLRLGSGDKGSDGGLSTYGVYDKFERYKDMDSNTLEPEPGTHKIWVGYELGPEISHCEVHYNECNCGGTDLGAITDNSYSHCGFNFTFDDFDAGGDVCHYESSVDKTNPTFVEIDSVYNDTGHSVFLDCAQEAKEHKQNPAEEPVPPSECIEGASGEGIWDWYYEFPYCTYWYPEIERERVCLEYFPNCFPPGVGQSECVDIACDDGSRDIAGTCIGTKSADDGDCTGEEGSCSTSGECDAQLSVISLDTNVDDCVAEPDTTYCNPDIAQVYECSYDNNCSVSTSTCSTASSTGTGTDDYVMVDAPCSDADCPGTWTFSEAEDCCKEWAWNCSAHCLPEQLDCREGHAVRFRQDWKTARFEIKESDCAPPCNYDPYKEFTIEFFHEKSPPPYGMEKMIKDIEDGVYNSGAVDEDGDGAADSCQCVKLEEFKDEILGAGEFLKGDDEYLFTNPYFTFEDYLNYLIENTSSTTTAVISSVNLSKEDE